MSVQSNLCITTTLGTQNVWPLLTGGRCSEVAFYFENWNRDPKIVVVIRRWSFTQFDCMFIFWFSFRNLFWYICMRPSLPCPHQPLIHPQSGLSCSQFHQHFTYNFFVRTLFQQLFSCYMYLEKAGKMTFVWKICM